jgi:hypothetical protein
MEIYNDYLKTIKTALQTSKKGQEQVFSSFNGINDEIKKGIDIVEFLTEAKSNKPLQSLETFANELGFTPNFTQKLGAHPHFEHLKYSNTTENHYIVSMFIDIKNSTNLFKRYAPETVFIITNTIQRAAIHTCLIFGGYVHRLQGDGLFVYFGGKDIPENKSVETALQAASIFSYFVKNDLKELFNEEGIETIFTRIGIDFGATNDVLWALAGIGEISEITTCSLHTSLASKMQGCAESNGIVAGDYIKNKVLYPELFTPVAKRTENEKDRYIFKIPEENFNYTQYDFDWHQYLKKQDYIATDLYGNLIFKSKQNQIRNSNYIKPIAEVNRPYFNNGNTII